MLECISKWVLNSLIFFLGGGSFIDDDSFNYGTVSIFTWVKFSIFKGRLLLGQKGTYLDRGRGVARNFSREVLHFFFK